MLLEMREGDARPFFGVFTVVRAFCYNKEIKVRRKVAWFEFKCSLETRNRFFRSKRLHVKIAEREVAPVFVGHSTDIFFGSLFRFSKLALKPVNTREDTIDAMELRGDLERVFCQLFGLVKIFGVSIIHSK